MSFLIRIFVESSLRKKEQRISERFIQYKRKMTDESQVTLVMRGLLEKDSLSKKSNKEKANMIYNYLRNRWNEKSRFVYVYDGVAGFDNHCFSGSLHHYVFRAGGKNVIAKSYTKPHESYNSHRFTALTNQLIKEYDRLEKKEIQCQVHPRKIDKSVHLIQIYHCN